jgi:hypothetical protein
VRSCREGDLEAFARAWGFSHVLRLRGDKLTLWEASTAGSDRVAQDPMRKLQLGSRKSSDRDKEGSASRV